jgi:Cellulase (glycosyl hydrolase family 5)
MKFRPRATLVTLMGAAVIALGAAAHGGSPADAATSTHDSLLAAASPAMPASTRAWSVGPPEFKCNKAVGPFSVRGTRVLGKDGKVFLSYGTTVPGLVDPNWKNTSKTDAAKIAATAGDWCGNTVRLQLSQDNLLGPRGNAFYPGYMNAVKSTVRTAERYHLVVVLNDSTESPPSTGVGSYQRGPTRGTETFWKDMTKAYGSNPQVIFDLFNEPRDTSGLSQAATWGLWRNGGTFDGDPYLGMEQLASYVRNTLGAQNLFWIEGPDYSDSFSGLERYHGLLTGVSNIVYAIHHPQGAHKKSAWYADFGYLVNTHVAPVVEGEWTTYAPAPVNLIPWFPVAPPPAPSECWPDAPAKVREYLDYLASHGIGMSAYQLSQYLLIKFKDNYAVPTTLGPDWSCTPPYKPAKQLDEGAGMLIMKWFMEQNSSPIT